MEISVAGAGAGKTTTMADRVVSASELTEAHQNIYCLAFTNNAVSRIEEKLLEYYDELPPNIKVSTLHSFLYQEIIKPYYFLLYRKQYEYVSSIDLPEKAAFKSKKISELDSKGIIHVSVIPQHAMWVVVKKTSDKKREKAIREKVLKTLVQYCGKIFIDEAQDIDNNILEVFRVFDTIGIPIELIGDPKQDLRGHGSFRSLVTEREADTTFLSVCHRCPQQHLKISNALIPDAEKQKSEKIEGTVEIVFESNIQVPKFLKKSSFDLAYISERNERFETHANEKVTKSFETLMYEIGGILGSREPLANKNVLASRAYYIAHRISRDIEAGLAPSAMIRTYLGRLDGLQYAKVISALQKSNERVNNIPIVSTIESIKGQEGNSCLFILTTDLAAYLFGEKTVENKTKNKLYVALTRSLNALTILVTQEVENKYGADYIQNHVSMLLQD